MKTFFAIVAIVISFNLKLAAQATIHSTTVGGVWNQTSTWVEGIIPDAGDNVIIQGPVIQHSVSGYTISSVYCNDLTITASGSLSNGDYGGGTGTFPVIVGGNIINNGVVSNGASDYLKIFVSGDLENNNIWMPYETEFQSAGNHNLSLAPGKSFGSKIKNFSPTLTAITDLYFTCDWNSDGNSYRDHFYLNNQTLVLGNHSIELYPTCLINKGKLQGDFEIIGIFTTGWAEGYNILDTLVFEGNITVTGTLRGNSYGGGYGIYKLKVIGNLINNGTIQDDYDTDDPLNNDDLNLLITGNIINNGIWKCNYTTLIGAQPQYVLQTEDKYFDSFLSDENSSSSVIAQSNITVTKDINLNGAVLDMANHTLYLNGWLKNGNLANCILHNGFLQNINSLNSLIITGKVTVDNGNSFQNTVIIEDTLQSNEYGGGSTYFTLPILGDITNNGVIQNINSGDMLSLEIYGNIFNNGLWKNSRTRFVSTYPQTMGQSVDAKFITNFYDLDSTSKINVSSDLNIEGNFDLGNTNLYLNGNEINLIGELYNGKIHKPVIKNAKLINVSVYDSIGIKGIVKLDDGNNFYGHLTVTDTMQSIPYGGGAHTYKLYVYGNLENYGLIRNEPIQGENFALYVMGDLVNKGNFTNYRTYQLYYPNHLTNKVICQNTGTSNWIINGATITENGSNAFTISSGGGVQTIVPDQSYDLTVQFNPVVGDTTALLTINCAELGTISPVYLIGNNFETTVDVEELKEKQLPDNFILYQNYPNPFNPSTGIQYTIGSRQFVQLKVYDVLGNEIATLVSEEKPAGTYEVEFNPASSIKYPASGIYFYQLKAGNYIQTKKMILMK